MNGVRVMLSRRKGVLVAIACAAAISSCMAGTYLTYKVVTDEASLFNLTTIQFIRYARRCDEPDRKQLRSRDGDFRCTRE